MSQTPKYAKYIHVTFKGNMKAPVQDRGNRRQTSNIW